MYSRYATLVQLKAVLKYSIVNCFILDRMVRRPMEYTQQQLGMDKHAQCLIAQDNSTACHQNRQHRTGYRVIWSGFSRLNKRRAISRVTVAGRHVSRPTNAGGVVIIEASPVIWAVSIFTITARKHENAIHLDIKAHRHLLFLPDSIPRTLARNYPLWLSISR